MAILVVGLLFLLLAICGGVRIARKDSSTPHASSNTLSGLPASEVCGAGTSLGAYDSVTLVHKKPKFVVVFLPGNPGSPRLYTDFAKLLRDRAEATVVVLGLVGHIEASSSAALPTHRDRSRVFLLDDQVAHVAERMTPYMKMAAEQRVPFVLAGHSIGSWIAVRAAQRVAQTAAAEFTKPRLLLITPFLESKSCMEAASFRSKQALFRRRLGGLLPSIGDVLLEPLGAVASVLQRLPEATRRRIGKSSLEKLASPYDTLVVNEVVHRGQLRNWLGLAADEFQVLETPFDAASELKGWQARAVYVPDDEWAPLSMAAAMKRDGLRVDILESTKEAEMSHAFSVQPGSCRRVADWAADALKDMKR